MKSLDPHNDFFVRLQQKEAVLQRQIKNWHNQSKMTPEFIQKVIDKYASKEYQDRWYNRGCEPPTELFYFMLQYAMVYGKLLSEDEQGYHNTIFTGNAYLLNGYVISEIHGQGTFIRVEKQLPIEYFEKRKWFYFSHQNKQYKAYCDENVLGGIYIVLKEKVIKKLFFFKYSYYKYLTYIGVNYKFNYSNLVRADKILYDVKNFLTGFNIKKSVKEQERKKFISVKHTKYPKHDTKEL